MAHFEEDLQYLAQRSARPWERDVGSSFREIKSFPLGDGSRAVGTVYGRNRNSLLCVIQRILQSGYRVRGEMFGRTCLRVVNPIVDVVKRMDLKSQSGVRSRCPKTLTGASCLLLAAGYERVSHSTNL